MPTKIELYKEGVKLKDAKDYEGAVEKLKAAIALDDKFPLPVHALAQCLTELGRHEEAIAAAKICTELEPNDYFSFIALSRAYQRGGFIPEAETAMMQGQMAQMKANAGS